MRANVGRLQSNYGSLDETRLTTPDRPQVTMPDALLVLILVVASWTAVGLVGWIVYKAVGA